MISRFVSLNECFDALLKGGFSPTSYFEITGTLSDGNDQSVDKNLFFLRRRIVHGDAEKLAGVEDECDGR